MSAVKLTEAQRRGVRVKGATCAHCGAHNRYGSADSLCPFCGDARLTRDQRIALGWLSQGDHVSPDMRLCSFEHVRLIEKGLAESCRLGSGYRIFITDAGRAALRGDK